MKNQHNTSLQKEKPKGFPPLKDINTDKYFYMPKFMAHEPFPYNALSVYPVLCSFSDFREYNWKPFLQNEIGKYAGLERHAVSKGLAFLNEREFQPEGNTTKLIYLKMEPFHNGKKRTYKYKVGFVFEKLHKNKEWQKNSFPFHTWIVTSGIWAQLTGRAKALYLIMRSTSKFDPEWLMEEFADEELTDQYDGKWDLNGDRQSLYINREKEMVCLSLSSLCEMAEIDKTSIGKVVEELENVGLVHPILDMNTYQYFVFLKPK